MTPTATKQRRAADMFGQLQGPRCECRRGAIIVGCTFPVLARSRMHNSSSQTASAARLAISFVSCFTSLRIASRRSLDSGDISKPVLARSTNDVMSSASWRRRQPALRWHSSRRSAATRRAFTSGANSARVASAVPRPNLRGAGCVRAYCHQQIVALDEHANFQRQLFQAGRTIP